MEVRLEGEEGSFEVAGTVFHEREPRVVRVGDYHLEFVPKGHLLVLRNNDVPGVVGKLGSAVGDAGINIAAIHLSRGGTGEALAVLRLDQELTDRAVEILRDLPEVREVARVAVGPL